MANREVVRDRQGFSLGGTLMAVGVICLLGMALAGLSVTHLRQSTRQEDILAAANAARSIASTAISRLVQQPELGKLRRRGDTIQASYGTARGLVMFNPDEAEDEGVPYSTNNLEETEDADGYDGALVPSSTVHLLAVGRSGEVERRVEAILRLPPFPWAIAAGGTIEARNGVLVAAMPQGVWPPPTDPSKLLPADLLANGNDPRAIVLGDKSTILGDVETPGQVVLDGKTISVRGEIRTGSRPVKLPHLDPTEMDPAKDGTQHFPVDDSCSEVVGIARGKGPMVLRQPLTLTNGQLFVDGDLTLTKGVKGKGMLVATGDITVEAGVDLEGLTELAVISGGHVTLAGHGNDGASLRGLFYAEKGLRAEKLTLVGSLLTGDASTGVSLDQVNFFYEPPKAVKAQAGTLSGGGITVDFLATYNKQSGDSLYFKVKPVATDPPGGSWSSGKIKGIAAKPAFYIDFQSTNGGFPVDVAVVNGQFGLSLPRRTLTNEQQVTAFVNDLGTALEDYIKSGDAPGPRGYFNGTAMMARDDLIDSLTTTFGQAGLGPTSSTAQSVLGDISQFLPLEDRLRVVSWLER